MDIVIVIIWNAEEHLLQKFIFVFWDMSLFCLVIYVTIWMAKKCKRFTTCLYYVTVFDCSETAGICVVTHLTVQNMDNFKCVLLLWVGQVVQSV